MESKTSPTIMALTILTVSLVTCSCRNTPLVRGNGLSDSPHRVRDVGLFRVSSQSHPMIADRVIVELAQLQSEVEAVFSVSTNEKQIDVIIFPDRTEFERYLHSAFTGLPDRRAFFVASKSGRTVYAYESPTLTQDIRHEATHALLYSDQCALPLWLDEGVAEWFENQDSTYEHTQFEELQDDLKGGWRPSLTRLEAIQEITELDSQEYREAWAWVDFLMSTEKGRRTLIPYVNRYLAGLEQRPLSQVVFREVARPSAQLLRHITGRQNVFRAGS